MQFSDVPTFDNIKSTNEYLQIGNRFVKNISYVDVENIDLPSEIEPYSILGGNGAAQKQQLIILPSSMNWKIMKPLFTIRSLPFHFRHNSKELDKKRKSTKEQPIILLPMPLLQKKFKPFFIISLLMDNWLSMHIFPFIFNKYIGKNGGNTVHD
jgi:hypothetical protein